MVAYLNETRTDHIITVEDPIEVVQPSKGCNVTQREVGPHTKSFFTALKGALREDPDVIVIGELRDLETIEMAISASETGHLVIGTMHTSDAATTLNRLLDVFPPAQQTQIRSSVAESLRGVVCQRLLPRPTARSSSPARSSSTTPPSRTSSRRASPPACATPWRRA
jgi:twitching motility protein PilT